MCKRILFICVGETVILSFYQFKTTSLVYIKYLCDQTETFAQSHASWPNIADDNILLCFQRNSAGSENPSDVFRFLVEERIQCCQTRRVRYTQRVDYCIQLPAPIEAATNRGKGAPAAASDWCSWRDAGLRWHQLLGESAGPSLEGHRKS